MKSAWIGSTRAHNRAGLTADLDKGCLPDAVEVELWTNTPAASDPSPSR